MIRSLIDALMDAALWLRLTISGSRYDATPFDLFASRCPACGEAYDGHESAIVGSAVEPWGPFVSAVENGDWQEAVSLGRSSEPIGRGDLVIAAVLRCGPMQKLVVILYKSPGQLHGSHALISQQILGDGQAERILPLLEAWRSVVRDRLHDTRAMRARMRSRMLPRYESVEEVISATAELRDELALNGAGTEAQRLSEALGGFYTTATEALGEVGAAVESTRESWSRNLSPRYRDLGAHIVCEAKRLSGLW